MLTAEASTLATAMSGEILAGPRDAVSTEVVVDSRAVTPGCAFVALPGERADGHDFLCAALERGARAVIVTRPAEQLGDLLDAAAAAGCAVIRVDDAYRAVQDLARYHRSRLSCAVVGITGSTGKTTTKDFVDAVLSTTLRVVSTEGNRNNELGVPLTVLRAEVDTDVLVVEMGMRGPGQIAELAEIARPTVAVITNVGTSHIEILGSQEAIADSKAELVERLPSDGAAFLNGDDAYSDRIAGLSPAPVTYYGLDAACPVTAVDIEVDAESRAAFTLRAPAGTVQVALPVPGRHNVYNALAAAAVGLFLGVPLEKVAEGLGSVTVTAMRMEVFSTAGGVTVVNDAYNANPVSMRAAIATLADYETSGARVAVLGDMAELGSLTELAHFRLGEEVAMAGVDVLVTVGERARRIAEGARAKGMLESAVRPCATPAEAAEVLEDLLGEGDVVLVKASRVMGLEAVVDAMVSPR